MFSLTSAFNQDISEWDVSKVTIMSNMFSGATVFNGDISKWNVSKVTNMKRMLSNAHRFEQVLCGAEWVKAKARIPSGNQNNMFDGSRGEISETCGKSFIGISSFFLFNFLVRFWFSIYLPPYLLTAIFRDFRIRIFTRYDV